MIEAWLVLIDSNNKLFLARACRPLARIVEFVYIIYYSEILVKAIIYLKDVTNYKASYRYRIIYL